MASASRSTDLSLVGWGASCPHGSGAGGDRHFGRWPAPPGPRMICPSRVSVQDVRRPVKEAGRLWAISSAQTTRPLRRLNATLPYPCASRTDSSSSATPSETKAPGRPLSGRRHPSPLSPSPNTTRFLPSSLTPEAAQGNQEHQWSCTSDQTTPYGRTAMCTRMNKRSSHLWACARAE